jgi:glycosyltransferase involved in cell wall biosynthesis
MVPVSAVVSAHNEEEYIAECLESILGQTVRVDELIMINDRSTDRTVDIASVYPVDIFDVEYGQVYMVKRAGICAARNDTVLVVDGDTCLAPDFLERGLRHLEEGYDVATGKVLSRGRRPSGDLAAFISNALPKGVYASGPGFVLDRRRYMNVCKVTRIDGFIDVCTGEGEVPLHRMNLVKDTDMIMYTELPSTGQRRMIAGVRAVGGLITAMKIISP